MKQQEKSEQKKRPMKGPIRYAFIVLGSLSLAIGAIGLVLPFLPGTPFFLFTLFCFAKSSRKLHEWFLSTKLYRKHLESFVQKRAMTWKTKLSIIGSVTFLMGVGFVMMRKAPMGQIVLTTVWLFHVLYFVFWVKTAAHDEGAK